MSSFGGFFKALDLNPTLFNIGMNKSKSKFSYQHNPGTVCGGVASILFISLALSELVLDITSGLNNEGTKIRTSTYALTNR